MSTTPTTSTTQLNLPRFGYGCWQLGSKGADDYWGLEFTDELADTLIPSAISAGITYFDTAEGYNNGDSERQLSKTLAKLSPEDRANVIIGTKLLPNNAADVRSAVEGMLERLQVSCLDLLMIHWPITKEGMAHFAGNHKTADGGHDYSTSDMEAVGEVPSTQTCFRDLMILQKEGKIKHVGVSNFGVNQLKEAMATGCSIAVNQVCYNMIFRACEHDVLPFCCEHNIRVLCYSVLMQGILTGRYATLDDIPEYRRRTRHFDAVKNPKSRHGTMIFFFCLFCFVLCFCFYLNFDLLVFLTLSFFFCGFENLILLTFTVLKPIFGYIGCCVLCAPCFFSSFFFFFFLKRGERPRIVIGKNVVSLVQHCQGSKLAHV